jgi:uncharacterized membrane protein
MDQQQATITCPACGGENDVHAVFCANPQCHKALGEFRYALEQLGAKSRWHQALADRAATFIGRPHFVGVQLVWIGLWVLLNSGIIAMATRFDGYPFGLLGLLLSLESVLITSVLIISSRAQTILANTRAELDYEVNVQTFREIKDIARLLETLSSRLEALEGR